MRKSLGNLSGNLLVNGQPAPASFIRKTSYVPQVRWLPARLVLVVFEDKRALPRRVVRRVAMPVQEQYVVHSSNGAVGRLRSPVQLCAIPAASYSTCNTSHAAAQRIRCSKAHRHMNLRLQSCTLTTCSSATSSSKGAQLCWRGTSQNSRGPMAQPGWQGIACAHARGCKAPACTATAGELHQGCVVVLAELVTLLLPVCRKTPLCLQ